MAKVVAPTLEATKAMSGKVIYNGTTVMAGVWMVKCYP